MLWNDPEGAEEILQARSAAVSDDIAEILILPIGGGGQVPEANVRSVADRHWFRRDRCGGPLAARRSDRGGWSDNLILAIGTSVV